MDYQQREQSEFNMAISYLTRLNILLTNCDDASMALDSHFWFHSLLTLYRELSTEMKPTEKQEVEKTIPVISLLINRQQMLNNKKGREVCDNQLYFQLHNLEIKLRGIIKDSGLQMKMKEDASRALR